MLAMQLLRADALVVQASVKVTVKTGMPRHSVLYEDVARLFRFKWTFREKEIIYI